jgi:hypothetical protein
VTRPALDRSPLPSIARAERRFAWSLAALVACAALAPSRAAASPWTPAPGHGYAKLWMKWLPGFGYHDGRGETTEYGAYHEVFLSAFGDVGLAPGLALSLHAPLVQTFVLGDPRPGGEGTRAFVGPGDPTLSLRWRFLARGRFVAAVDAGLRVPLATARPQATVYAATDGQPAIGTLQIGSGVFAVPLGLSAGYGWDRLYLAASAQYVARTGGWDDVLAWSAELGGQLSRTLSGRVRVVGWHDLVRGDAPRTESPSGINNGTRYVGFGLEGEYALTPTWWLGASVEGGLGAIRRQTGGPVLSLFVATRY